MASIKWNQTTAFHPRHLAVGCSICGAAKGSRCRNGRGEKLVRTHSERGRAAKALASFKRIAVVPALPVSTRRPRATVDEFGLITIGNITMAPATWDAVRNSGIEAAK